MASRIKDFDRFIAEREDGRITVRIFDRECSVPTELPWHYVMKVEAAIRSKGKEDISWEDNLNLLKQMFSPEDFEYITRHSEFRGTYIWELISYIWLRDDENSKPSGRVFKTEDDVKVEQTKNSASKKGRSAR